MKKFCTNCGHANEQDNRICVECGTALVVEKQNPRKPEEAAIPAKNKKPLSLKTKILSLAGILVFASLIGVYSWGTKTASADNVVTKFFEALQNEDAEALSKQGWLSNGQAMTVKEADAFIGHYRDISPYELEDVARVEKNGKVIGIFDAHRVVIPAQKRSFNFPDEGLSLSLNGELVASVKNTDGQYIFSELSPGLHEAEFIYEGEFAEFSYPFELEVAMYSDPSVIEPIHVNLPIGSVMFGLETFNAKNPGANKVLIGDKEIPVDEYGETDGIGPLLLDGSTVAQAEVAFPWGTQLSEPAAITSGYHTLEFSGLEEKHRTALIEQVLIFAEEYVQAYAQRDPKVFTGVGKDQLSAFKKELDGMKSYDSYFKGSLTEVGVDEESIAILSDGETVTVDAVLQFNGDYYYSSDTPELDEFETEVSIDFIYDTETENWLVQAYSEDNWFLNINPTISLEGSGKVFETAGASKAVEEDAYSLSKEDAEWFMSDYNDASVEAINEGDFSIVSYMVYGDGPRTEEQSDFVDYMYSKGITEEHLTTTVEKVEALDGDYYEVTTIETFIIHGTEKSNEKTYRTVTKVLDYVDGIYVYELISTTEI